MGSRMKFKRGITTIEATYLSSCLIEKLKHIGEAKYETLDRIMREYATPDMVNHTEEELQKKLKASDSEKISRQETMALFDKSIEELSKKDYYDEYDLKQLLKKTFRITNNEAEAFFHKGISEGKFVLIGDNQYHIVSNDKIA